MCSPPFLIEILSFEPQIPQSNLQLGFISLFSKLDRSEVGSWSGTSPSRLTTAGSTRSMTCSLPTSWPFPNTPMTPQAPGAEGQHAEALRL